jgi:hypothetical protein
MVVSMRSLILTLILILIIAATIIDIVIFLYTVSDISMVTGCGYARLYPILAPSFLASSCRIFTTRETD